MQHNKNLMSFRQSHLCGNLRPHIDIPGDKSISHRALFLSALATGNTLITGLNHGEDLEHTQMALEALGITIENKGIGRRLVHGLGGSPLKQPKNPLHLGNSGSSARLVMGLASPFPLKLSLYGDSALSQRPMRRITLPLLQVGATFESTDPDRLPLTMTGTATPRPVEYQMTIPSAQTKTAMILAAMNTPGITRIIEPIQTRDHTERLLQYLKYPFTIEPNNESSNQRGQVITIPGKHNFIACPIDIPADTSSAAFFVVAALITPHSHISIEGVNWNPYRNRIFEVLQMMGGQISVRNVRTVCGEEVADIEVLSSSLNSITLEAHEAPYLIDEYPILAVAAAQASGISVFNGLRELQYKESNRLEAINQNMNLCGIETRIDNDALIIHGNSGKPIFGGVNVNAAQDHRIAMSFYVLGMVSRNPIMIQWADCMASSFPNFNDVFNNLSFMRAA